MLRTAKKEISFNVTKCQIVNDGFPFFRVTCESILISPEQRQMVIANKNWFLDGAGGPIKQKDTAQFVQRHHMPHTRRGIIVSTAPGELTVDESAFSTGAGYFSTDLIIDLYIPKSVLDIQFDKYNDEREAIARQQKLDVEEKLKEQEKAKQLQEEEHKKAEDHSVNTFRRTFNNLDV